MSTRTSTFLQRLHEWSAQAARAQVADQVPLTESVRKIAAEHGLNPNQVARLCEAANHAVYGRLFKEGDGRLFSFPVADYTRIMSELAEMESQPEPQAEPEAPEARDTKAAEYGRAPGDVLPRDEALVDHVFRHMFPKGADDSTALQEKEAAQRLQLRLNRQIAALSQLQAVKVADQFALDDREEELYGRVRQAILEGETPEQIYQVIHNLYPAVDLESAGSTWQKIFERLKAENLIDPRLEKEDFAVEPHLVNRESPVAQSVVHYREAARKVAVDEHSVGHLYRQIGQLEALRRRIGRPEGAAPRRGPPE